MAKGKKTGGRKKGSLNHANAEIRQIIDETGDMGQLIAGLFKLAPRNPKAAEILLAYRYGKPKQELDLNHAGSVTITLESARTIIDHLFNGHPEVSQDVPSEMGAGPFEVPGSQ